MTAEPSRRQFLADAGSCAVHLSLAASLAPAWWRKAWTAPRFGAVVAAEPFGRLEEVGPGVWAMISTPLTGDRTTICNGGIIQGRSGVAVFEAFFQPAGAKWLADKARELTGRWPTHAIVSHYHSDHSNGVAGYGDGGPMPALRATAATRDQVGSRNQADADRARAFADVRLLAEQSETIDLGGRSITVLPRAGHTSSDVALTISDAPVVFGGDLVWNGMFPNYVDCVPTVFAKAVREVRDLEYSVVVPGHGPVARRADLDRYVAMIDEVGNAARAARARGQTAAEGAAAWKLPDTLGEWVFFNPRFLETAFTAWYRELGG